MKRIVSTILIPLFLFFGGSAIVAYATTHIPPNKDSGRYIIVLPECVDSETVPCANHDEGNNWRVIFEYAPNGTPLRYAPIEKH